MAFYFILRFIPIWLRKRFKSMIVCSTIKIDADKFLVFVLVMGFMTGILVAEIIIYFNLLSSLNNVIRGIMGFVIGFILVETFFYLWINLSIDSKTRQVEEILPDVLQLMSSNIRAGLTTDKALILSGRPEFGPLAEEIKRVGRETMMGRDLASALMDTTKRIRSDHLTRTMELIVSSIQSGGELADLLDQTASDLRDQQLIHKEISAGVLMYVIFIFIAIGIGAPALFVVSTFLVKLLAININTISSQMPSELTSQSTISLSGIDEGFINFIEKYAYISLMVSSIFGGIIMSLIRTGNAKGGVKYIVILIVISFGIYFVGSYIMNSTFAGMLISR